jgi:hypothetical protein
LQHGQRQFLTGRLCAVAAFDGMGDGFVGVAKRQALSSGVVGQISGGGVA